MTQREAPAHARTRFRQATELLASLLAASQPADALIDRYFRAHREMGSQDRAFAAETVYACLRRKRELQALVRAYAPFRDVQDEAEMLTGTYLATVAGWSGRALTETALGPRAEALVTHLRAFDRRQLTLGERLSLPDWLCERLCSQYGEAGTEQLAQALGQTAPVDLRVNTRRVERATLQQQLTAEGYDCEPTPLSPWGLRRAKRGPLFNTRAFREGLFELQDEASQLVSWLVAPRPRQTVIDYCAGAGGKTLHLADLMNNRGTLYACDIATHRLEKMKPRLIRAGLDNVRLQPLDPERTTPGLAALQSRADAVLVDAPCSGTGTLRRNPDMKWRDFDIDNLQQQQLAILRSASELVKPGGRLVYATCSLLHAENQAVVDAFLAAHPGFERAGIDGSDQADAGVLAAVEALDPALGKRLRECGELALRPDRHHTDGFFGQRLIRRTSSA